MNTVHEHCLCRYRGEPWASEKETYTRANCCRRDAESGGGCLHEGVVKVSYSSESVVEERA